MTPRNVGQRVASLDVLRGIAILLVLGYHAPATPEGAASHALIAVWKRCGWAGVDLFFALSGFLIMGLLLAERERTGAIDVKAFLMRRLFKIYPPYIAFVTVVLAWDYHYAQGLPFERLTSAAKGLWPVAAQLQNFVPIRTAPHLWSLAMEEHCYALLLALAVFQASRRSEPRFSLIVPTAVAGLFTASWLARWAHVIWSYPGTGSIGLTYTQHRIDAVLAGALAAWLVRTRHGATLSTRARAALAGIAIACFLPTLSFEPYDYRVLFLIFVLPLQAIGFGCLLVAIGASSALAGHTTVEMSRGISAPLRLLAFVGVTSYSTYLWHMPFADVLVRLAPVALLPAGGAMKIWAAYLICALVMGALMFWLIERPAQGWRRRWQTAHDAQAQRRWTPAEVA